ncbi:S antigen precursor, putative [Perkinsus marinus ATCC 50983]|uniref:S antigen, putative n=1 Tax=Perkinsus marinus (strain ATCC 50983 / TXsc) TaxID=423536 RepID=C5KUQ0_PERM5|nr:S antigen precursor, putative [Perkinsus marinus ATCC 50983]EER11771.1 S antigen precursor, putative [Perkinsus marinus ATCC 50983]|eukprot:XP_002779976.1 S antigen precursor, putative [Perkinsus marinus ATCC 50983]
MVEELRRSKQKANQQEVKILALREELKVVRESLKEKERALSDAENAVDSKRDEVDGELLSKLKSCRKDLRSREGIINELRRDISAKKCEMVEAESRISDLEARLKTVKMEAQRQGRTAEQMKSKAMEAREALAIANRAGEDAKDKENRLRSETERLKRQLEVTTRKLEKVSSQVEMMREQEARRAEDAIRTDRQARKRSPRLLSGRRNSRHSMDNHWKERHRALHTVGNKSCEAGHLHGAENSDLSSVLEMTSRDIRSGSAENDSDLHMITLASLGQTDSNSVRGEDLLAKAIRESLTILELSPEEAAGFLRPLEHTNP